MTNFYQAQVPPLLFLPLLPTVSPWIKFGVYPSPEIFFLSMLHSASIVCPCSSTSKETNHFLLSLPTPFKLYSDKDLTSCSFRVREMIDEPESGCLPKWYLYFVRRGSGSTLTFCCQHPILDVTVCSSLQDILSTKLSTILPLHSDSGWTNSPRTQCLWAQLCQSLGPFFPLPLLCSISQGTEPHRFLAHLASGWLQPMGYTDGRLQGRRVEKLVI